MQGKSSLRNKLQKGRHVIQCSMLSPLRGVGYRGLPEAYSCDSDLHFITTAMQNNITRPIAQGSTSLIPKLSTWHNTKPVLSTSCLLTIITLFHCVSEPKFCTYLLSLHASQFPGQLYTYKTLVAPRYRLQQWNPSHSQIFFKHFIYCPGQTYSGKAR
jgi:hypothetical protein